jgi:three-Cys-motif partner protein
MGVTLAPTFAFLDPFGFSHMPIHLIERIVRNSRCEGLITFMYEEINRFLCWFLPTIDGTTLNLGDSRRSGISDQGQPRDSAKSTSSAQWSEPRSSSTSTRSPRRPLAKQWSMRSRRGPPPGRQRQVRSGRPPA